MARPRVFISSTYFDLRVLRADLERFIREMGYEPVLFERGHVPWGKEDPLEDYCYREISGCDLLVSIIGGRYGSQSRDQKSSITQREIRSAIELGKQVYIFVEKSVLAEYRTYLANKENDSFVPASVNDKRIFQFIEEIYQLNSNNVVEGFELPNDITRYLREQWAGLFQRLLTETARANEASIVQGLKQTAATLDSLVSYLVAQKEKGDVAINDIMLLNHPAFNAVRDAAGIPYRIIFENFEELDVLLKARSFRFDKQEYVQDEYQWDNNKANVGVAVKKEIFDADLRLRPMTSNQWKDSLVRSYVLEEPEPPEDFDIPF
ncbi:hypothetical protein NB721_003759 [Xanthomonas sacchari]|nr:hypothetical protein [Xanthomonas sacchari]MCW0454673.1 hypothetical protein [Xanthomonas sacchari]